jgi:hypothetical protein
VNRKVSEGQRYICSNPQCRCEMQERAAPGPEPTTNPHCICGSRMKKLYQRPTLSKLTAAEAQERLRKAGPH